MGQLLPDSSTRDQSLRFTFTINYHKKQKTKPQFEEAISRFQSAEFQQVIQIMETILKENPEDQAVKIYIDRCQDLQKLGVDEHWTGVTYMDTK